MGRLTRPLATHTRIGLDTSAFIYHLEHHPRYSLATQELLSGVESGRWESVTPTITPVELTVRPWQLEHSDVTRDYDEALTGFPHLQVADVTHVVPDRQAD